MKLLLLTYLLIVPVTAQAQNVTFPSNEVEFVIGPQVTSGSSSITGAVWFDSNAFDKGLQFGAAFPATPPYHSLPGTISLTQGSRIVSGTGTQFLTSFPAPVNRFNFYVRASNGVLQTYFITSVESNFSLTLSQNWQLPTQSGRPYLTATGDESNAFLDANYYDQAQVQYINYYRTGDARFLTYARKIADSWWLSSFIDEGRTTFTNQIAPRNVSLNGLILRALDGRPEMWPWIVSFTRDAFSLWVGQHINDAGLYFGAREGGYMLLFAANLAKVHPDPVVRAEFQAKAIDAAVNYYARLQLADGTWRWLDPDFWTGNAEQPFHVGILLEGMIATHRLTGNTTVRTSIIEAVEGLYLVGFNPVDWDAMYYQVGGAFLDGTSCATGCGLAAGVYPGPFGTVAEARQLNATCIHSFGYAFAITSDLRFRDWGDEIFAASFGAEQGFRMLAWFNEKNYDEAYRTGGHYLAWREAFPLTRGSLSGKVKLSGKATVQP